MLFLIRERDKMCHTETHWKCWLFGSAWFTISFCGPNNRYKQTNQQKSFWQSTQTELIMLIAFSTCRRNHRNSWLKDHPTPTLLVDCFAWDDSRYSSTQAIACICIACIACVLLVKHRCDMAPEKSASLNNPVTVNKVTGFFSISSTPICKDWRFTLVNQSLL